LSVPQSTSRYRRIQRAISVRWSILREEHRETGRRKEKRFKPLFPRPTSVPPQPLVKWSRLPSPNGCYCRVCDKGELILTRRRASRVGWGKGNKRRTLAPPPPPHKPKVDRLGIYWLPMLVLLAISSTCLTLFSEFFSSFPRGTLFAIGLPVAYLALDE